MCPIRLDGKIYSLEMSGSFESLGGGKKISNKEGATILRCWQRNGHTWEEHRSGRPKLGAANDQRRGRKARSSGLRRGRTAVWSRPFAAPGELVDRHLWALMSPAPASSALHSASFLPSFPSSSRLHPLTPQSQLSPFVFVD